VFWNPGPRVLGHCRLVVRRDVEVAVVDEGRGLDNEESKLAPADVQDAFFSQGRFRISIQTLWGTLLATLQGV
jgi:hypothetical protein